MSDDNRHPLDSAPLPPPVWAARSLSEDGGVTHETISSVRPTVRRRNGRGTHLDVTEVSLSTTDLPIEGRWSRTTPTVQIEGGSYPLHGARQLRDALEELLRTANAEESARASQASRAAPR